MTSTDTDNWKHVSECLRDAKEQREHERTIRQTQAEAIRTFAQSKRKPALDEIDEGYDE